MKIKEKVLKEFGKYPKELGYLKRIEATPLVIKAIDLTLAEVGKVIDDEIKAEIRCLKTDEYDEQFADHNNQIEMASKIKQKLGIEVLR